MSALPLENKVALVTGAGRGIGRAIAIALARMGAKIAVTDIHLEPYRGEACLMVKQSLPCASFCFIQQYLGCPILSGMPLANGLVV